MTSQANTFHAPQSSRGCPRGPLAPHLIPEQNALPSDSEQLQEFEYVCHGVLVSCHMHSNLRTLNDTSAGKACILLALCESFRTVCSVMVAASLCPTYSRRWLAGTAFSEYLYLICEILWTTQTRGDRGNGEVSRHPKSEYLEEPPWQEGLIQVIGCPGQQEASGQVDLISISQPIDALQGSP